MGQVVNSASLDEWQRTFDAITDIITIQDPEMRIIRANLAAGRTFGVSPQELVGRYCYELFRGSKVPCEGCPVNETLRKKDAHSAEIDHPSLRKIFSVSTSPVLDEDGRIVRIIHSAKDITDKKYLQEQLLQAHKMEAIGTLAAGIAHDFNNILTSIIGYGELARETLPPEHRAAKDISEILHAGQRARTLVQQILTIGRKSESSLKPLRLQPIIQEAVQLLRASLPRTIEIALDLDETCSTVLADPTQIHQVIMNLCTNAFQAMRERGGSLNLSLDTITLSHEDLIQETGQDGLYARLRISDTGCGIDRIHLERIFDPYFSTKRKGEGTGLGLAMVHSIIKNHGGQIHVYSEEGNGSIFTVYLPHCQPLRDKEPTWTENLSMAKGTERILILDDEEHIVTVHQRFLQGLGYQVDGFSSCKDAILAFREDPAAYDLIITDMTMPYLTGIEFAEEIMRHRCDIPIIVCTGFSDRINLENAQKLGIRKLIMKPATLSELGRTVRELLDNV